MLSRVGEDKLRLQFINDSLIDVRDKNLTQDTEITFATGETNANHSINDTGKVGIVVWIDRKDYNNSI